MTAFARREARTGAGTLVWELRSVNHRYLDVSVRLPEELRALEPAVRERVGARLRRGKVDCALRFQPEAAVAAAVSLNRELAGRLADLARDAATLLGPESAPPGPFDLLRWPGVVREEPADLGPVQAEALALLDAALDELEATRAREGARIEALLRERIAAMRPLVARARERRPQVIEAALGRWRERLRELGGEPEPGRLEQELALQAQRLDVAEELDRLEAHLDEAEAVLGRGEPVGRRLDFLMQELNREANTLAAKSADAETTRIAVELKVLIEQMREQVQNVE